MEEFNRLAHIKKLLDTLIGRLCTEYENQITTLQEVLNEKIQTINTYQLELIALKLVIENLRLDLDRTEQYREKSPQL